MIRASFASLLALVLLGSTQLPFARADEVSLKGDFAEPRLIVAAPADPSHAHLSWPKIVTAKDGTLVMAYIAGRFHGSHGEGSPTVSISTDQGKTFSEPHLLKKYTAKSEYTSAGNVALGVAEEGSIALLSMAYNADKANTIDAWRSTDNGKTWEVADASTLDHSQTGSVYGNVMPVPEHGLAVIGHYRKGSKSHTQGLWLAWSQDQGKSWGSPERIVDRYLVEPAVVFTEGEFLGLIRTGKASDSYTEIRSSDLGHAWQVKERGFAFEHEGTVQLPSPCLVVDPANPKRLYCLASERHTADNPGGLLGRIVLWQAELPELKWKELGVVAKFPRELGERKDITYGWMSPLGDSRWYVVFYCGKTRGASDLYGLEIEVPEK